MKTLEAPPFLPEDQLTRLPLHYRNMICLESATFPEHYTGYRFSESKPHRSHSYLAAGTYKPIHDFIYQELFNDHD